MEEPSMAERLVTGPGLGVGGSFAWCRRRPNPFRQFKVQEGGRDYHAANTDGKKKGCEIAMNGRVGRRGRFVA